MSQHPTQTANVSMQTISILGSTGSIGQSTLDVVLMHPERYRVFALTAHKRFDKLIEQAHLCTPQYLVIADPGDYVCAKALLEKSGLACELLAGTEALEQVASASEVDVVMAAIVGAAGLLPTLAAVKSGKKVLLANKESLVMSGELFMRAVEDNGARLLPIDSEHNAIFQCLPSDYQYGDLSGSGISKILLTGSGGPFLRTPIDELANMTPDQACAHPNWQMGRKISVDSATMMNKGLEFIEARWLFGLRGEDIQVVLHPQSIIHSMVQYKDGSVIAQMGNPDMRTPIAHGLAFPERIASGVKPLDFQHLSDFTFATADPERYPNLHLAMQASEAGQYASTVLNAANEVAVQAFLSNRIGFTQIAQINQECLQQIEPHPLTSIEAVIQCDEVARQCAVRVMDEITQIRMSGGH
ncbi:MAG: 1-deoxy-D-xylulose-5-phosphate reductoisomerase [Paraglaciecola sp.]|jgi:1-deoxy-D-xylulose-5-phosphate reductoisomerase